ncbi:hypothetical protein CsSME_00037700 [Camellia sinensis var. sinensis]
MKLKQEEQRDQTSNQINTMNSNHIKHGDGSLTLHKKHGDKSLPLRKKHGDGS